LSGFDLQKLTAGYSKCEGVQVGSATVQLVCEEYATRRKQFKKLRLNWRVSNPKSARRSLGWVPFKAGGVKYKAGQVSFLGHRLSLWDSYGLSKYELKTNMAKSTLDAGWSMLKTMLEYKSHQAGIVFEEVNEAYTTQTCSSCGVIPASSPKGRAGLGMRRWSCCNCGAEHDRDVNAARNIAARGHARLAGGIPIL
jgi:transposase